VRRPREAVLELASFAALAWYATAHWTSGLVADAPGARAFACVLIALAVGTALELSRVLRGVRGAVLRAACVLAGIGAGLVAIGLDRHLLAPRRWDDLGDGLDRGFAALGSVQWPYDGPEPWAALVLLLAVPLVVVPAAAFASWPGRGLRPVGLVLLVALYGVAVTEHRFDGELGRGIVMLLLVAAWLWLPRMPERGWQTAAIASGAVLTACVVALPAAARYDDREPWVDYESWNPFAAQAATRFDWSHSYGPIDWPREGTTLMNVRSDERHYWKVETLDRFDGFGWVRSGEGRGNNPLFPQPVRDRWVSRFRVTIRDLDTNLFPIAGTSIDITGEDTNVVLSEDGTVETSVGSLDEGDSYGVEAYVPDPTPDAMRAAPVEPGFETPVVPGELQAYTALYLPPPGTTALDGTGRAGDAARSALPDAIPASKDEILDSPYAPALRLARRLARGQDTPYDVVRAVQRHLRSEYAYSEQPPSQEFPLAAFLFEDRAGYCQHFSGAMTLMLRMLDIPARVAAGFTPGSYNRDTSEYRVRDLDAHSWVEVWFTGIGWVPFDPTPSIAPAESQSSADAASASGGAADAGETQDPSGQSSTALSERAGEPIASDQPEDGAVGGWVALMAIALLAGLGLAGLRMRAVLARRRRAGEEETELADLRRVLARIGEPVPPRLTLRELERRLERTAGAAAARYVRMLRERRYAPRGGRIPDAVARRDLRRALGRGRGLRGRLLVLVALPPVSFRRG
jgi:transglutaminase-like putative cysteine protease